MPTESEPCLAQVCWELFIVCLILYFVATASALPFLSARVAVSYSLCGIKAVYPLDLRFSFAYSHTNDFRFNQFCSPLWLCLLLLSASCSTSSFNPCGKHTGLERTRDLSCGQRRESMFSTLLFAFCGLAEGFHHEPDGPIQASRV